MAVTLKSAQSTIEEFNKSYPVAPYLYFCLRHKTADIYGEKVASWANIQAAYSPYIYPVDGYKGRIDIILERTEDEPDLIKSLNHEILGHYGLNTFTPQEKKLFLNNVIKHKDELKPLWDYVERHYPNEPLYIQAEEVFCYVTEKITPDQHLGKNVRQIGEDNFRLINYFNLKPLTEENLKSIVLMVADGISDRSRVQQTFPTTDLTNSRPPVQIKPPVTPPPDREPDRER